MAHFCPLLLHPRQRCLALQERTATQAQHEMERLQIQAITEC